MGKTTICPHDEFCGGCIHQGKSYEEQLKIKEQYVFDCMAAEGVEPLEYLGFEGCPEESRYGYRNKMEYTFGDFTKGGPLALGMHRKKNFMSIVTVDQCQLVHGDFNKILQTTIEYCEGKGYTFCNKKSHQGLLRHLIIRRGIRTGELIVNIVTTSQGPSGTPGISINPLDKSRTVRGECAFDGEGYVKALQSLNLENRLVGIMHTINDRIADAVYCDELRVLFGQDYYMEKIMGLDFKVSIFSFFQTNVEAAERLYTQAIGLVDDWEGKTVYDLYCGTGTITQALSKSGAREVIGIELVEDAVDAARMNAELNGLDNVSFLAGDVFEQLDNVSAKPDMIVVDPPRVGILPKALGKILAYGVDRILYISCNPKTLAQNLHDCVKAGYRVDKLKAYDNFPGTKHVECVALISRK